MDDLSYSLRQLCKRNRDGSHATQADRRQMLTSAMRSGSLGVGATAAIFTLVSAVLMRNLPVTDPKSLVRLVVLLVAALIARLISASRAAFVDPIRALRAE
jgi:hypothetical protein